VVQSVNILPEKSLIIYYGQAKLKGRAAEEMAIKVEINKLLKKNEGRKEFIYR